MMSGMRIGLPVARYLRPEEAVVPFRPRPELGELMDWCTRRRHAAVRLVIGGGGAGKTRLALQLRDELTANGWQLLWMRRGSEREAVNSVHELGRQSVLVVDYAETYRDLAGFLDDVAADEDGPDLRVVLLARSAGEWWQQILADSEEQTAALLGADPPVSLGPVYAEEERKEFFDDAVTAFAQKMGIQRPDVQLTLSDADPVVLVVHAAALLAVVDYATGVRGQRQAVSGQEILQKLLDHEARYWKRSATSRGLILDLSVLRQAVTLACLIGADHEIDAGTLLARVPDLDSAERRGQVARWLHDLYPRVQNEEHDKEWLGSLRPDRLAEQLVVSELGQRDELIRPFLNGLSETRATKALRLLARAAMTQDHVAEIVRTALAADLEHLAVPAVSAAVTTNPVMGELLADALSRQTVSREILLRIAEESPYPSFALAMPTSIVFQRLADGSDDDSERAKWLNELGNSLGDLGRREDALAASKLATTIYRELAQDRPNVFLPYLAASLNNESNNHANLRRIEDALSAVVEAGNIYRQLMATQPIYITKLAIVLSNQSNFFADLRRFEEALTAIQLAISIYRMLDQDNPQTFLPDLAMSLHNQSACMVEVGQYDEALASIEEAVAIRRLLTRTRPDAIFPDFATSLINQCGCLTFMGRHEEALAAIEEAIGIYRELARTRPDAYLPDLAKSLNNRCGCLNSLGRHEDALDAIELATSIYRKLDQDQPQAFFSDLAMSLHNRSKCLTEVGRHDEALTAAEEAVGIRRELAQAHPAVFLPDLARSLNNLASILSSNNQHAEASKIRQEAEIANQGTSVICPETADRKTYALPSSTAMPVIDPQTDSSTK